MASATESAPPTAVTGPAPARQSWIDALIAWLDALRGPTWRWLLILAGAGLVFGNAAWWLDGHGVSMEIYWSVFGLFPVVLLALIRHLDRVAVSALDTFRPLLDRSDPRFAELRHRLAILPAVPTAIYSVVWILFGVTADFADPAAHRLAGVRPASALLIVGIEVAINALLGAFLLKAFRHFLDVDGIHREAPRIDLLEPAPLYAFSRLTSQTALGILFVIAVLVPSLAPTYFGAASASASDATRWGFVAMIGGLMVAATAMFVLPLYGMHRRIVVEKERLQAASGARLTAVLADLDRGVRSGDLARADGLNKQLASVLAERDLLAKLPTWPWQAATLRAFVSALILPVLIYVLARAAERVVL